MVAMPRPGVVQRQSGGGILIFLYDAQQPARCGPSKIQTSGTVGVRSFLMNSWGVKTFLSFNHLVKIIRMDFTLRVETQTNITVVRLFKMPIDSLMADPVFNCHVSIYGSEFEAEAPMEVVQELHLLALNARIPIFEPGSLGLHGINYELEIDDYPTHAHYRWWLNPPKNWEPLDIISRTLLGLAFRVSGAYLP